MRNREISNSDDVIDSRDIIARIEELQDERDAHNEDESRDGEPWELHYSDDAAELTALLKLQEQAEPYAPDWRYGESLIRGSYFETYAEELADDIGAIDRNASWPLTCIDWEQAALELQMDYTSVDFDGVTYWVR